jgi:hypothetical protein
MCHSFRAEMRQSDSVQHHRHLLSFAKSGEQIIVLCSEGLPFTDSESVGSRLDIRCATHSLDYFLRMARWIVQMKSAIRAVVVEPGYSHRATRLSSRAILASRTDQQVVLRTRHPGVLPSRRTRHGWRKVRLAGDLLDRQHFPLMPSHLIVWLSPHILGVNRGVFRNSIDTHDTIPALPWSHNPRHPVDEMPPWSA